MITLEQLDGRPALTGIPAPDAPRTLSDADRRSEINFFTTQARVERDNAAFCYAVMCNLSAELADEPLATRQDELRRKIAHQRARREERLAEVSAYEDVIAEHERVLAAHETQAAE